MNRRQFLKRVGTVCAAAVVVPTALIKIKKSEYDCWHDYYMSYDPPVDTKLLNQLTAAVKNTKFTPPFKVLRW